MNNDPRYLQNWLVERQSEWESIGIKLRDLSFINQDVANFAQSVWRQTDAKATECSALRSVIVESIND